MLKRTASLKTMFPVYCKVGLVLLILFALQIGYVIPLPGINTTVLKEVTASMSGVTGGFIGALTGNSFETMSLFALSITPSITASIIMQLLSIIIKPLDEMDKQGSIGTQKKKKITNIIAIGIALFESICISLGFLKSNVFLNDKWYWVPYATVIWTAGAAFLIWVADQIEMKLIGNGISLMLLFNMIKTFPADVFKTVQHFSNGETGVLQKIGIIGTVLAILFLMILYVVYLDGGERRLKLVSSQKAYGVSIEDNENSFPIKVNIGGVMPVIYASSIINIPYLICAFAGIKETSWFYKISMFFNQTNWFNPNKMIYSLGVIFYIGLIFFFAFFNSIITFNAKAAADSLRKGGAIIDGKRPGEDTADYLTENVKWLTFVGAIMICIITLVPIALTGFLKINSFSFGGTTVIIIVGVVNEMTRKIKAQTVAQKYKKYTV